MTVSTLKRSTVAQLPLEEILDHLDAGRRVLIICNGLTAATERHRRLAELARTELSSVEIRWANGNQRITHTGTRGEVVYRTYRSPSSWRGWSGDVVYIDRVPDDNHARLLEVLVDAVVSVSHSVSPAIIQCNNLDEQWLWPTAKDRA